MSSSFSPIAHANEDNITMQFHARAEKKATLVENEETHREKNPIYLPVIKGQGMHARPHYMITYPIYFSL